MVIPSPPDPHRPPYLDPPAFRPPLTFTRKNPQRLLRVLFVERVFLHVEERIAHPGLLLVPLSDLWFCNAAKRTRNKNSAYYFLTVEQWTTLFMCMRIRSLKD